MNQKFKERLRDLRVGKNMLQAEVAEILGVNRSTYGAYERGTIIPPMDKIQRLADLYGVSVEYLLGNTNNRAPAKQQAPDISKQVEDITKCLADNRVELTLDGEVLDAETRDALRGSLEGCLRMVRLLHERKRPD